MMPLATESLLWVLSLVSAVEIHVPDTMEDGGQPQIARSQKQYAEEQADGEDRCERRDGRSAFREVVEMQRTEGEQSVADEEAG
jgi:hypothetical protein